MTGRHATLILRHPDGTEQRIDNIVEWSVEVDFPNQRSLPYEIYEFPAYVDDGTMTFKITGTAKTPPAYVEPVTLFRPAPKTPSVLASRSDGKTTVLLSQRSFLTLLEIANRSDACTFGFWHNLNRIAGPKDYHDYGSGTIRFLEEDNAATIYWSEYGR